MKVPFCSQNTRLFRPSTLSALLLTLPLIGFVSHLPSAQAQPVPPPPIKTNPLPPSPEQRVALSSMLGISRQEKLCKTLVSLKVENASLEDVISRLKQLLPTNSLLVETRDVGPVRVSCDLKQISVGDVLGHVSALGGSKVFVRPEGLLISSPSKLSETEAEDVSRGRGGEWSRSTSAGGSGWSIMGNATRLFSQAIAQEATGSDAAHLPQTVVKTTFGSFSPESQALLQEMANWLNQGPGGKRRTLHLDAASPITIDTTGPNAIMVLFDADPSNPNAPGMYIHSIKPTPTLPTTKQ